MYWSLIATQILNSYAVYFELRMLHAYNAAGANRKAALAEQRKKKERDHILLHDRTAARDSGPVSAHKVNRSQYFE